MSVIESDVLWQQCLTAARQTEAERFAKLPPRPIRYAEECETLDPYREDDSWQFRAAPYWGNPL